MDSLPLDVWRLILGYLNIHEQAALCQSHKFLYQSLVKDLQKLKEVFLRENGLDPKTFLRLLNGQTVTAEERSNIRSLIFGRNTWSAGFLRSYYSVSQKDLNPPNFLVARFYNQKKDLQYELLLVSLWKDVSFSDLSRDAIKVILKQQPSTLLYRTIVYNHSEALSIFCSAISSNQPDLNFERLPGIEKRGLLGAIGMMRRWQLFKVVEDSGLGYQNWLFPDFLRQDVQFLNWIAAQPFLWVIVIWADFEPNHLLMDENFEENMSNLGYTWQMALTYLRGPEIQIFSRQPLKLWY